MESKNSLDKMHNGRKMMEKLKGGLASLNVMVI